MPLCVHFLARLDEICATPVLHLTLDFFHFLFGPRLCSARLALSPEGKALSLSRLPLYQQRLLKVVIIENCHRRAQ